MPRLPARVLCTLSAAWIACATAVAAGAPRRPAIVSVAESPVTLVEDIESFTLDSGKLRARIEKSTGNFTLRYRGNSVVSRGYWSQVGRTPSGEIARFGSDHRGSVRIDPGKNGGERVEVSCRFGYVERGGGLPCDVELRYSLAKGDSALAATAIWDHKPGFPSFSVICATAYDIVERSVNCTPVTTSAAAPTAVK